MSTPVVMWVLHARPGQTVLQTVALRFRWLLGQHRGDDRGTDLSFHEAYLGGVTVFALDPTLAVELEAIRALVKPVEFGWRWVTGHRNTSTLLPAAILGALSLEGPSSRKR